MQNYSMSIIQCASPHSKDSHLTFWKGMVYEHGKKVRETRAHGTRLDAWIDASVMGEALFEKEKI